ncbi:MAG TPA: tRNA-dihydrouridine synthase, partial [Candidatus Krumholzibacteria bacterium]|nr:tRNA-dihydrouridine synthase [Candidatus Krumholzibacteria bacterium]
SSVPVSAKIRAGWDRPTGEKVRELARTIEDAGVTMLALHARTRQQGFTGRANWDLIAEAKRAVSIPVIGNGDVRSGDDVVRMVEQTGCDAVMIGRAAIGNPWIFQEVKTQLAGGAFTQPTPRERIAVLLRHVAEAARLDGEPGGVIASRKVMAAYLKRMPDVRVLRAGLMQSKMFSEVNDLCNAYLDNIGAFADIPCVVETAAEEFVTEC